MEPLLIIRLPEPSLYTNESATGVTDLVGNADHAAFFLTYSLLSDGASSIPPLLSPSITMLPAPSNELPLTVLMVSPLTSLSCFAASNANICPANLFSASVALISSASISDCSCVTASVISDALVSVYALAELRVAVSAALQSVSSLLIAAATPDNLIPLAPTVK